MNTNKKVLFITMPIADLTNPGSQKYLYTSRAIVNLPYGLLSICTYVKEYSPQDVELKILDINDTLVTEYTNGNEIKNMQAYFENLVTTVVSEYQPDIVGISMMFNVGYQFLDNIATRVKETSIETMILVGGNLATVLYEEIAGLDHIDAVIYGEGELPFLQLVQSDDIFSFIQNNDSFVTKEKLVSGIEPNNQRVEVLDDIPSIDFNYVNLNNFNQPKQKGTVYKKDFDKKMVSRIIYVSRGCPYNCNFCAGFNVHGKKVRYMSIERVLADVKAMVVNDGLTDLYVCDDSFLLNQKRAKAIMKEFVKMGLNVSFPAILMRNIDDEVAELLAKLGNTFQYTSMESGSEYVLKKIIQKPVSKEEAKHAVNSLRKYGISALTNIVVGFPEETDEHRQETLETLYNIGFSWAFFMIALPLPGSRLFKQCKENGYLINENFFSPSLTECNIRTPFYSPKHIEKQAYMMNLHANFVHNYNLRTGNYDECIISYVNLLRSYPEHAFAYHSLARAYEGKGEHDLTEENRKKYNELINKSTYWKDWADYFNLV